MSYLRCCSVLSLTVISSCFSVYSSGPTAQEVIGARRVRAFLAGFGNPFMVGPTFKNVVEGNARDTGPISVNAPDGQIEQQKRYIQKHIREHGHASTKFG